VHSQTETSKRYRYTGKERDEESGLYYHGARYYAPWLGRWTAIDPLQLLTKNKPDDDESRNKRSNLDPRRKREISNKQSARESWPFDLRKNGDEMEPKQTTNIEIEHYLFSKLNPVVFIDPDGKESLWLEIWFGLRNPIIVQDIRPDNPFSLTSIAGRLQGRIGVSENDIQILNVPDTPVNRENGSQRNAFRHTFWMSTITRSYGRVIAQQVANAKDSPGTDTSQRQFRGADPSAVLARADTVIDLLNNEIGRRIGEAHSGATNRELALLVLEEFRQNGLWTVSRASDGSFTISRTLMTDEDFQQARAVIETETSAQGLTHQEQADRDAVINRALETIDRIPACAPRPGRICAY
jgi:hypothetical protein